MFLVPKGTKGEKKRKKGKEERNIVSFISSTISFHSIKIKIKIIINEKRERGNGINGIN